MTINISANLVNELRAKTGAGIMDCKKALIENNGDLDTSIDWLRKKGAASVAKKADREAKEGAMSVFIDGDQAVVLEVNCETDFVARNDKFQDIVKKITEHAVRHNITTLEGLIDSQIEANIKVSEYITNSAAIIGEKLSLGAFAAERGSLIFSYVHNAYSPTAGKIAVLVSFDSNLDKSSLQELGRKVAMHIAAADPLPLALNISDLDENLIDREKSIFADQAKASGKPEAVIEKMLEGKMRTFYEGVVLNEQISMLGDKMKIKDMVNDFAKSKGGNATIKSYQRFQIGRN